MNGYELTRRWFDFAFETKEAKCTHTALFMFIVELNNRLGWKRQFGIPTMATMEGLSIGNKTTYLTALRDLKTWGFIEIIQDSKNQFSSTIIEICYSKSVTASVTALDTALIQQKVQQSNANESSTVPIDKPLNKETNKQVSDEKSLSLEERKEKFKTQLSPFVEKYGKELVDDFFKYWTEPDNNRKKFRREDEKFFDIGKRLGTFKKMEKPKFGSQSQEVPNTVKINLFK
jgi:hypothetical protein